MAVTARTPLSDRTPLLAGAATVDITPEIGQDLSGYAARRGPAEGIHDRLLASAVAVSDGSTTSLVIAADLVALDPEQVEEIGHELRRLTGIPTEWIAVSVSHTHSGPAVTRSGIGGVSDPSYVLGLLDALVRVGARAVNRLRPARLSHGTAELPGVASNRRGGSTTDPLVGVVRLRRPDGTGIATVFSYACHPVALGPDNLLVTADWPGFARRAIAREIDGVPIFLQGCCGQLNTGHTATDSLHGSVTGDQRTFDAAERIGVRVAEAVGVALSGAVDDAVEGVPDTDTATVRIETERLTLPLNPRDREQSSQAGPPSTAARSEAGRSEVAGEPAGTITVPVSAHRWGTRRLVFLPGEPFVEFALELREALSDPTLPVLGYTGGVPGYLPYPVEHYRSGGYEVTEAHHWYGQPAAFAPVAGERVRQAAERLGRRVNDDGRHVSSGADETNRAVAPDRGPDRRA